METCSVRRAKYHGDCLKADDSRHWFSRCGATNRISPTAYARILGRERSYCECVRRSQIRASLPWHGRCGCGSAIGYETSRPESRPRARPPITVTRAANVRVFTVTPQCPDLPDDSLRVKICLVVLLGVASEAFTQIPGVWLVTATWLQLAGAE